MSTFKTALRMALAHPFYLLIYTVFISLMGVFIAASVSWNSSQLTEYEPYDGHRVVGGPPPPAQWPARPHPPGGRRLCRPRGPHSEFFPGPEHHVFLYYP